MSGKMSMILNKLKSFLAKKVRVNNVNPRDNVNLRIYPLNNGLSEIIFWCNDKLVDIQKIKNTDLKGVHF